MLFEPENPKKRCLVFFCERHRVVKDLCRKHYNSWMYHRNYAHPGLTKEEFIILRDAADKRQIATFSAVAKARGEEQE